MTNAYKKELKYETSSKTVVLGGIQVKEDFKNEIYSSPIAQDNTGDTENLALNLNRVKKNIEATAQVSDPLAAALNGGQTKEDVKQDLLTIFQSQEVVTMTYGNETFTGFIQQLNITENSEEDNSFYEFKIRLLVSKDMQA